MWRLCDGFLTEISLSDLRKSIIQAIRKFKNKDKLKYAINIALNSLSKIITKKDTPGA